MSGWTIAKGVRRDCEGLARYVWARGPFVRKVGLQVRNSGVGLGFYMLALWTKVILWKRRIVRTYAETAVDPAETPEPDETEEAEEGVGEEPESEIRL